MFKAAQWAYIRKFRVPPGLYLVIFASLIASLFSSRLPAQQAPSQDQSTASDSATQIDEAWQKASAKYDQQRDALLATVEKECTEGPFQPDWQSASRHR